jgi:SAM-dependent methyltransferase
MYPSTAVLFDRLEVRYGMNCLDVGCGGGDVTVELARRVGTSGKAVGVDIDEAALELARRESKEAGIENVEFHAVDFQTGEAGADFDLVYARFLLTHLSAPDTAVARLIRCLRPGGILVVEDTDFGGSFTWPQSDAFRRYYDLYISVVRKRGGDPHLGRRLPFLLAKGGLADVDVNVVQPVGIRGEAKLLNPMTMENIAESVVRDGLAARTEIESVVRELYRFAADPGTIAGLPRIVQTWGRRQSYESSEDR